MDKLRLVNMASDLMLKQVYSDLEIDVLLKNLEDGSFGIILTHLDDRYEYGNNALRIYDWQSESKIMKTFEYMKEVIAGERLITNEWNT